MELSLTTIVLLPIGLGLLGFIEPCTIGAHLLFLNSQNKRTQAEKIRALALFIAVRSLVAGTFGLAVSFLGQRLISLQTGMWLVFGSLYLIMGLVMISGKAGIIKRKIDLAPATWKHAQNPAIQGIAFGLNIPACAAPILFGLLSLSAGSGTIVAGFTMMFLFGLFLSLPLALFAFIPHLASKLEGLGQWFIRGRWVIGAIFIGLGSWSIWFGLYVDPVNWSGQ